MSKNVSRLTGQTANLMIKKDRTRWLDLGLVDRNIADLHHGPIATHSRSVWRTRLRTEEDVSQTAKSRT